MALAAPRAIGHFGLPAPYDEGNTLVAAWRVLEGERLYADVWQMHAPGTAWGLAVAFELLGTTLFTERLVKLALVGTTVLLLYALALRAGGAPLAAAAALLYVVLPPESPFLRPNDPALATSLAALVLLLAFAQRPRAAAFVAGLCLGLTSAFRLDFGFYAGAAAAVFLLLRRGARQIPFLGAGAAVGMAPVIATLFLQGVAARGWEQMMVFPATTYSAFRGLPIVDPVAVLLPLALGLAGVGVSSRFRRPSDQPALDALLLTALLSLAYLGYARVRPDPEHTLPSRALAAPLAASLVGLALRSRAASPPFMRVIGAFALLALLATAGPRAWSSLRQAEARRPPGNEPRVGPLLRPPEAMVTIARLIRERSAPDRPIFVGNERHDRILLNDVLTHFVSGRRGITRYYNLHPGLATTERVQNEIVAALDRERPLVVLWRAPSWEEPNRSATPGSDALDRAIRAGYRSVASSGLYSLWEPVPTP